MKTKPPPRSMHRRLRVLLTMAALAAGLQSPAFAQAVTPPGTRVELPAMSAAEANALLAPPGTPPFLAGSTVMRLVTTAPLLVARTFVFNPGSTVRGSLGSWMLPIAQLRGKSRAQYLDFWALPIEPGRARNDSVAFVLLPVGTHLWSGVAGPIADANGVWGNGGGAQYYVGPDANVPAGGYQTTPQMFFTTRQPLETIQTYGPRVSGATAALARYLDDLTVVPFSDLDGVLVQLDVLPLIDDAHSSLLTRAVRSIGPARYADLALVGLRETTFSLDAFARRGGERAGEGAPRADSPRAAVATFGPDGRSARSIGGMARAAARAGVVDAGSGRLRAWFRGGTSFDRQVDRQDLPGFSSQSVGGLGGVDTRIGSAWAVGIGGGVRGTPLSWSGDGGDASVTAASLAGYVGFRRGRLFVDGAVAGGRDGISAHRRIAIPGVPGLTADLARTADSRQTAWTLGAQADVGIDVIAGPLVVQPLTGISSTRYSQSAFTESGATSLNLAVDAYRAGDVQLREGFRVERAPGRGRSRWGLEGQALWTHAIKAPAPMLTAGLLDASGRFSLQAAPDARDGLAAGVGLVGRLAGTAIHVRYDGDYSRDRRGHALSIAADLAF